MARAPGSALVIRSACAADGDALARIYNHYVVNTTVSFEEAAVTGEAMAERVAGVQAAAMPWLVAEADGAVLGYAYADKWKGRCAYRYSAEVGIYLDADNRRSGIGSLLYGELLAGLKEQGIHTVLATIALPNDASVAFHEKHGFVKAGHFTEVGFKQGQWLDVGYWQLTFEGG